MNNKYIVSSEKFNDLCDFLEAHYNLSNHNEFYDKYSNSPFAKFSWLIEADASNEQLIIFNYIVAKWLDKQITSSDKNIQAKLTLILNNDNLDLMKISFQNIDNDLIEKMFLPKNNLYDLEDNLINLIGHKI